MGELIDREKLLKVLKNIPNIYSMDIHCDEYYGEGVQRAIEEAMKVPIVDAVPVIRCKDCKYAIPLKDTVAYLYKPGCKQCTLLFNRPYSVVLPDFYCVDGEKEDDTK